MTRLVLLLMVTAAGAARPEIQRRRCLAAAAASTAAPAPADASGLLLLPPTKPLTNRYVLVRAGESRSEADGVIETNAARKFLFSNGLTEEGAKQASAAADAVARVFGDAGGPPVVRYATARHCKQTADILGARLAVPSSKLLPEADLLLVLGTSLAVQPFASLVGKVRSDTPRVLLNAERVGCTDPFLAMLGIEQPPALLAVESRTNYRDVLHLGECDASVRELSSLAGWHADLKRVEKLVADAHRKGQRVAPPPPPSAPPPRRISPRLPSLDLAGVAKFLASDECRSVVLLTGAGVSCGAGIPDFRSAGGMYDTLKPELLTATPRQRALMARDPLYVVQRDMFAANPFPYLEVRRPFILGTQERRWRATLSHHFFLLLHAKTGKRFLAV